VKICPTCRTGFTEETKTCPHDGSAPIEVFAPGTVLRRKYEITALIGMGGMAVVYRARHLIWNEERAIKILRQTGNAAFLAEAQIMRRLQHPHIVRVDDADFTDDDEPFVVMECIEGEDLAQRMQRGGRMAEAEALQIAAEVCSALVAAHACGVVHRDIKPHNLLLARGAGGRATVKVIDFGIARVREEAGLGFTGVVRCVTGDFVGTPDYVSPEQASGVRSQLDGRTDIYSLGLVLYQMLTGALPFRAETPLGTIFKRIQEDPEPPERLRPELRAGTCAIVMRALQRERDARYGSASEMQSACEAELAAMERDREAAEAAAKKREEEEWAAAARAREEAARREAVEAAAKKREEEERAAAARTREEAARREAAEAAAKKREEEEWAAAARAREEAARREAAEAAAKKREEEQRAAAETIPATLAARRRLRRRLKIAASAMGLAVAGLAVFTYYSAKYGTLVDAALRAEPPRGSVIYSAPRTVTVGEALSPEKVAEQLRLAGYTESRDNRRGYYQRRSAAIEIYPGGPDSYFDSEPGLIRFQDGHVSQIVSLQDNASRPQYQLEPAPMGALGAAAMSDPIRFRDIPPVLVQAITAIEDQHFFQHAGLDPLGGGPTINTQVAAMLMPSAGTWGRRMVAVQLDQKLTKEELFARYVNTVPLRTPGGSRITGLDAAMRAWCGKSVAGATLAEAAQVAGLIHAGDVADPARIVERRNMVLTAMHEQGYVSDRDYAVAVGTPLTVAGRSGAGGAASAPIAMTKMALEAAFQDVDPGAVSLRVYTTFDPELQAHAEAAVGGSGADLVAIDPTTGGILAAVGSLDRHQVEQASAARLGLQAFADPLELAAAYAALANGEKVKLGVLALVRDADGKALYRRPVERTRAPAPPDAIKQVDGAGWMAGSTKSMVCVAWAPEKSGATARVWSEFMDPAAAPQTPQKSKAGIMRRLQGVFK
jgi:hypothetical protein